MAKVIIDVKTQPEKVVVETKLTPAHFLGAKVEELKNEKGESLDFRFGLATSGATNINPKFVQFVGVKKNVKLSASAPMSQFGATVEDAKMCLAGIVEKATALENKMIERYTARKAEADKITVVEEETEEEIAAE